MSLIEGCRSKGSCGEKYERQFEQSYKVLKYILRWKLRFLEKEFWTLLGFWIKVCMLGEGYLVWVMNFPSSVARYIVENKIENQVSKSSFIVNK